MPTEKQRGASPSHAAQPENGSREQSLLTSSKRRWAHPLQHFLRKIGNVGNFLAGVYFLATSAVPIAMGVALKLIPVPSAYVLLLALAFVFAVVNGTFVWCLLRRNHELLASNDAERRTTEKLNAEIAEYTQEQEERKSVVDTFVVHSYRRAMRRLELLRNLNVASSGFEQAAIALELDRQHRYVRSILQTNAEVMNSTHRKDSAASVFLVRDWKRHEGAPDTAKLVLSLRDDRSAAERASFRDLTLQVRDHTAVQMALAAPERPWVCDNVRAMEPVYTDRFCAEGHEYEAVIAACITIDQPDASEALTLGVVTVHSSVAGFDNAKFRSYMRELALDLGPEIWWLLCLESLAQGHARKVLVSAETAG